jgi:hypothetical protein
VRLFPQLGELSRSLFGFAPARARLRALASVVLSIGGGSGLLTRKQSSMRWPVRKYRDFGPVRLTAHGGARWRLPDGEFTYGEFDLQEVAYNVRP